MEVSEHFVPRRCEVDVSNNGCAKELMSKGLGSAVDEEVQVFSEFNRC